MNATIQIRTNIGKACAKETTRYAIGGYRIHRGKDGQPWAMATDGRQLSAIRAELVDGELGAEFDAKPNGADPYLVPAESTGATGARLKLNGRIEASRLTASGKPGATKLLDPIGSATNCPPQFPPVHDAAPDTAKGNYAWLHLNPGLLAKVAAAIADGPISIGVELDGDGKPKRGEKGQGMPMPIIGRCNGGTATEPAQPMGWGVLMPVTAEPDAEASKTYAELVDASRPA